MCIRYRSLCMKMPFPTIERLHIFKIVLLGANHGGASWAPQSKISQMFSFQSWQLCTRAKLWYWYIHDMYVCYRCYSLLTAVKCLVQLHGHQCKPVCHCTAGKYSRLIRYTFLWEITYGNNPNQPQPFILFQGHLAFCCQTSLH